MKQWFKNNGLILVISLILVAVFAFGGMLSNYVIEQRLEEPEIDEERYYEKVNLTDLEYNFDEETLGRKTYVATFIYEESTYKAFLDNTFTYVEMIEGDTLDLIIFSAVKHHAEQEQLLQNIAYISSYDETSKALVITADGFAGTASISVEFILNDDLDGVASYAVTSSESYTSEYNTFYVEGAVPFVENSMLDQFIAGNAVIDSVAGASQGTGDAMQELITLLDLFLDSMEGGN
jgi:hypothetical protein